MIVSQVQAEHVFTTARLSPEELYLYGTAFLKAWNHSPCANSSYVPQQP